MSHIMNIDPKAIYLLVAGLTWLIVWAWRRWLPGLWDTVTQKGAALQQLPALVLSALLSTAPALGKPLWEAVQQIVISTAMGWFSSMGLHVALKDNPAVPYDGARKALGRAPVPPPTPPDAR